MRLATRIASTNNINSPAATFGATIWCSAAYIIRILNDTSAYRRTVALKYTMVIIRSILQRILMRILSLLSEPGLK